MSIQQTPPDAVIDHEWRTLARKLALAKGFCFIVYFVTDERSVGALKTRLTDELHARAAELIEVAVEIAAALAPQSLSRLFEASAQPAFQAAKAVFWIEAFRGVGRTEWDDARREFLMRLNERRSRIEDEVRCPLILLLPANWQRDAAALAPDMWHVRVHSAALQPLAHAVQVPFGMAVENDTALALQPLVSHRATGFSSTMFGHPQAHLGLAAIDAQPRGDALAAGVPAAVAHWQDVFERSGNGDVAGNANQAGAEPLAQLVSLWDGLAAVDAWLERGRADQARPVAEQVLGLARQRATADDAASPARRDLSVILNAVGDVACADWRFDDAACAYEESLNIRRQILRDGHDHLPALRDLSVSLNRLGDVASAQGRLDAAESAYDEGLDITRRLLREGGESLSALRDLSVSLNKAGNVASVQGRLDAAARDYEEGLSIRRRLLRDGGASLPALRDLSVSLNNVGDVANAQGRFDAAARAYDEGLDIARQLLREGGETLSALRDLSVSLNNVGDVARAQGRFDDAARAMQESLEIDRRRVRVGGETPQNLDDLAISLLRVAALDGIDPSVRRSASNEALSLFERLVNTYPELSAYADRLDEARRLAGGLVGGQSDNISLSTDKR